MITQLDLGDICSRNHGGASTSIAANAFLAPCKASLRLLVLKQIRLMSLWPVPSQAGQTCEEIEHACGLSHQTASARCSELKRDGNIEVRGKRKTTSGCLACVYFYVRGLE